MSPRLAPIQLPWLFCGLLSPPDSPNLWIKLRLGMGASLTSTHMLIPIQFLLVG